MPRRIAEYAGNVLLALVILIALFFILGPRFLGVNFFTIYSGSMEPSLPIGSVVMIRPVEASSVDTGDVIAFKTGTSSETLVHRVIEIVSGNPSISVRTGGDANSTPDTELVPAENIIGKVFFHMPFLGYMSDFARTNLGYLILVVLPTILIIFLEIRNIIRELRLIKTPVADGKAS